jgi:hypothetical protein
LEAPLFAHYIIMNVIQETLAWLTTSSADPKKYSLALKGALKIGAGYLLQALAITCSLHLACLNIDSSMVDAAIQNISACACVVLWLWGAGQFVWGIARKAWLNRWSAYQAASANLPTS